MQSTYGIGNASSLDMILKYSPFRTEEQLFAMFEKINAIGGTRIVLYNIKYALLILQPYSFAF